MRRYHGIVFSGCFVFGLLLLLVSCTTMGDYDFSSVDASLENGQYESAYEDVSSASKKIYGKHDEVLRNLDLGVLSHYAGSTERSNTELEQAERLIEEYSATSITQAMASAVVNDNVKDYEGEFYEDIYINILKCINYLMQGSLDEAFVEIRRFDNKLREFTVNSQTVLENARRSLGSDADAAPKVNLKFHNSAFARYLSMILYRARFMEDDVRIDYNKIQEAFALQPELYDFPVPACIEGDRAVESGKGRLNIFCFTGQAPVKTEDAFEIPLGVTFYRLALPKMEKRSSRITSITVTAVSSDGKKYTAPVEKLESLENIALDTYQQHYALIFIKTLSRSIAKAATTAALEYGAKEQNSMVLSLLSLASAVTTKVSERADVRTSRYFPSAVSVAGFTLDPGSYDITLTYYGENGRQLSQFTFPQTYVYERGVNLLESFCLR